MLAPSQTRDVGIEETPLETCQRYPVGERKTSSPTRPKASHPVGSRTEERLLKGSVRSRGEARSQAASLNSENCIVVDHRTTPGNRRQSRRHASTGRQQSCSRSGQRAGHHRGLRAGHAFTGVNRELGRASRLLGSNSREGDRRNQHPGIRRATRPADEPNSARAVRNTKRNALNQGTGREPKAHRPERTKAVVAMHSTAGTGEGPFRKRGEPRPKGPTITLSRAREGKAGHDVCAEERQEGL